MLSLATFYNKLVAHSQRSLVLSFTIYATHHHYSLASFFISFHAFTISGKALFVATPLFRAISCFFLRPLLPPRCFRRFFFPSSYISTTFAFSLPPDLPLARIFYLVPCWFPFFARICHVRLLRSFYSGFMRPPPPLSSLPSSSVLLLFTLHALHPGNNVMNASLLLLPAIVLQRCMPSF